MNDLIRKFQRRHGNEWHARDGCGRIEHTSAFKGTFVLREYDHLGHTVRTRTFEDPVTAAEAYSVDGQELENTQKERQA